MILNDEREPNLTKQYYARLVHYHIKHYLCSKELKKFFNLPPERQSLEKGAYFFACVFQPKAFEVNYREISLKLDRLAKEVQSHLKLKNMSHPAISIELFSPDEPLENTKWSHVRCIELFKCINYVLNRMNIFQVEDTLQDFISEEHFREMHHVLLSNVIDSKKGNDITLLILYNAICHRLGILLHPTIQNNRYMLKWKCPNVRNITYINPFSTRRFENLGLTARNGVCITDCSAETVLCHLVADSLHIAEKNVMDYSSDTDMIAASGMYLLFESISEDENEKFFDDVFAYCLKYEVHLETIIEICEKLLRKNTVLENKIRSISNYANDLITQQKEPRLIKPKRRTTTNVKYAVGMIIKLNVLLEHGVIFGWDKKYEKVNESTFKKDLDKVVETLSHPFYKILSSDGSRYYLAEKSISLSKRLAPINHCEVGKYFRLFNGIFYVPNEELRLEYPDDEKVKHKFLKDYALLKNEI